MVRGSVAGGEEHSEAALYRSADLSMETELWIAQGCIDAVLQLTGVLPDVGAVRVDAQGFQVFID